MGAGIIEAGIDIMGSKPALVHVLGRVFEVETGAEGARRLSDRRGECIYAACQHYHKCFVEKSIRRARRAEIVIANHALVMIQAALGGGDGGGENAASLPTRYVFDEGHHVFDAADGAFSGHLTALEMVELRRWLLGAEGRGTSRARGLKTRVEDMIAGDDRAEEALRRVLHAARCLPGEGWNSRIGEGQPDGPAEALLALVRKQTYARQSDRSSPYGMETDAHPPLDGLLDAAATLEGALGALLQPIQELKKRISARLDTEADQLDTAARQRMEAVLRSLTRRGEVQVGGWRGMLKALAAGTPPEFVDWFAVDRFDGRDMDYGMHRHWVDPTLPFIRSVVEPAQGVLVTSATLRDGSGEVERDWAAESRVWQADLPAAESVGQRAAERAIARAGARKPRTGACPVLFDERVAGSLIGHLLAAINGATIARGSGWLRDALGQPVLPAGLDLLEEPRRLRTPGSRPFDAEGLATRARAIIADGTLTGWVLDLSTGRRLGLESTANASRGTAAPPSPATTNVTLSPGRHSRADLLRDMGTGLVVTSLIGSAINPTTGDYSRGAAGFWVEGGEIVHAVNECTIAGNLRDMLMRIVPANDALPHLSLRVPSLLVDGLTLAGG